MQNSATHFSSLHKSYGMPAYPKELGTDKSYSANNTKSLGDPALSNWLGNATAYYKSVISGQTPKPSPQEWNQFMQYLQWAKTASFSGGQPQFDPNEQLGMGGPGETQTNDYGGELGPNGTFTYDSVSSKIGFTGPNTRNDVFATDNELNIEQASASVSCEETMDHGVQVLKVIVKTGAPGHEKSAVYYYDNYKSPDFKLNINVPFVDKVTGADKFAGKITVAKFDPNSKEPTDPEATMAGVEDKNNKGTFIYKPKKEGGTIEFNSTDGTKTNKIWSDCVVSAKPGDTADLQPNLDGTVTLVLNHEDGTTTTYIVQKEYKITVNIKPGNLTVNGKASNSDAAKQALQFFKDMVSVPSLKSASDPADGGTDASAIITQLLDKKTGAGKTEAQLISALNSAGYGPYKNIDQVKAAVEKGDIPGPLPKPGDGGPQTSKFINFLAILDDQFSDLYNQSLAAPTNAKKQTLLQQAQGRLVELISIFYPSSNVKDNWNKSKQPDFTIDGVNYRWQSFDGGLGWYSY